MVPLGIVNSRKAANLIERKAALCPAIHLEKRALLFRAVHLRDWLGGLILKILFH